MNKLKMLGVHALGCSLVVLTAVVGVAAVAAQILIPVGIIAGGIYLGVTLLG